MLWSIRILLKEDRPPRIQEHHQGERVRRWRKKLRGQQATIRKYVRECCEVHCSQCGTLALKAYAGLKCENCGFIFRGGSQLVPAIFIRELQILHRMCEAAHTQLLEAEDTRMMMEMTS